jgi:hypothetical protein
VIKGLSLIFVFLEMRCSNSRYKAGYPDWSFCGFRQHFQVSAYKLPTTASFPHTLNSHSEVCSDLTLNAYIPISVVK